MWNKLSTGTSAIFAAALFLSTTGAALAQSHPVGILALYSADDPGSIDIQHTQLADLDCELRHAGVIAAAQGDINLEQPNQFILLACADALMNDTAKRARLEGLSASGRAIALLEGDLMDFPDAERESDVSGRQYILKISHYNNLDIAARDEELAALTAEAATLPDTYVTEAFMGVNHAAGLPTPDEVVVLFYDDPDTGDRFRENNGKFLKRIAAFNQTHLIDTVYYIGQIKP